MIRNLLKRFSHRKEHVFGPWYIAAQRLVGPYGVTENPIQERICSNCGLRERHSLKKISKECGE